jgi:hypothetical protein
MNVQCGIGFVWYEDFEKIRKGQWAQEREIKAI